MAGIQTAKNLYQGINPHLNSLLQTPGNETDGPSLWPGFHANHISHIADKLNEVLPPNYVAIPDQSLQIKAEDIELAFATRTKKREPDVSIYGEKAGGLATASASPATLTLALNETLDIDEDFVTAVVIRDMSEGQRLGKVVTRLELLSPSNKPGHYGYEHYRDNRIEAVYSGIPLIEIDYLHETPPPVMKCPIYPRQASSHAYNIYVNLPHVNKVIIHGFDVDALFPNVVIPLSGDDEIVFDFGLVYQHTYRTMRWGTYPQLVDYTQIPPRFETYSSADQERIRLKMAAIQSAYARGDDLENMV